MSKLSICIPSRNEPYLNRTIEDIFANARGEVEVVVALDGYWPEGWKELTAKYPNLHSVHSGEPIGMRGGINRAVASAASRGAKYIAKFDAHCSFGEGFDEILKADLAPDWIVVPRRKRLNPETWTLTDTNKPDVDYHYLSFPDDPSDFGGKGLNGKIWPGRAITRAEHEIDEEMSSQGSGWAMHTDYFYRLELMDEANYGKFWNEFQELGLKCWLSGGRVMVNKKTWYSHWHKGKSGRGYKLPESWLQQGATFTRNWIYNDAWAKQTLPFSWLIERFWPVPSWPENWQEVLYAERKPRTIVAVTGATLQDIDDPDQAKRDEEFPPLLLGKPLEAAASSVKADDYAPMDGLVIQHAYYGVKDTSEHIDVSERLTSMVVNDSLDIVVNNSTLVPGQNPYRGKKKTLTVFYYYGDGPLQTIERDEKEWLIIGEAQRTAKPDLKIVFDNPMSTQVEDYIKNTSVEVGGKRFTPFEVVPAPVKSYIETVMEDKPTLYVPDGVNTLVPTTPAALNDYLIRKFSISPQRLRGPMPIELRDFHRNDLAQMFAELGFKRGAEIGVAEGRYSEVLLKANPDCELLLVDPWHRYSDNPQGKSAEKHEYAYQEMLRKTKGYHVRIVKDYSMHAVRDVPLQFLDWVYIDAQHQFDYVVSDLVEWSKRVRSGGIVSGDDYYQLSDRWGAGPVEAVQAYTNAHKISTWFICGAHKSVDYFWVKP